ncbi:hypothetical protein [Streptomyces seoulensis]|uniref:hypothetical protein n=1 Tax=Streptomyces seoulensis TaxID=73044 RepID=UPI001FCB0CC6|nr:hypothetical protein [Streptomyces seoulensis]BDH08129.1 hypothetical protein HEK131_53560 [Streptomyces seoulensis]
MTVLLWILAVLALPFVLFAAWMAKVFLKEFFSHDPEADAEAAAATDGAAASAALGLLPAERQDTRAAGPLTAETTAALAAVQGGDWRAAAGLMASVGRDWERRSSLTFLLADRAADDDEWLLAWEAERPGDPDAAVVRARSSVILAWRVRGGKRAEYTTQEQFQGFHRALVNAREDIARAAELNPDDPTPHIAEIWVALGLGYPNARMDTLWTEITRRAPHHYEAHFSALQYWCAKWRGSERLATEFAERAAAGAPVGSLLTALPLIAHFEHDDSDDTAADNTPEMVARVEAALKDAAAADPAHPRLPELRHLLAYYLHLQGRDEAAVEYFRLVDGHVDALPWRYRNNKAEYFCEVRDRAVLAGGGTGN